MFLGRTFFGSYKNNLFAVLCVGIIGYLLMTHVKLHLYYVKSLSSCSTPDL